MNWKIVFQLSIFGLIMAVGTVSLIPEKIEPIFWLFIFLFCAYVIAKVCNTRYFLNGFMVCILNCMWITAVHFMFRKTYFANHPAMVANIPSPFAGYSGRFIILSAPIFGILSGIALGLLSLTASKIVKKRD